MQSEQIAAHSLAKRGFEIRERRYRTPFAEVDLLGYHPGLRIYVLVEVKTRSDSPWSAHAISQKQIARLRRARAWIESARRAPVRAELALVDAGGEVEWVADFLC